MFIVHGLFLSQSLLGVCLLFCLTNAIAPFCVRVTGVVAVSSVQWVCPALSWVHFLGASSVCRVTFGSVPSGPFMKLIGSFSCSPPGIRPRSWLFRVLGFVRVRFSSLRPAVSCVHACLSLFLTGLVQ